MPRTKCYVDTETTGLDPRIHQPWELSMWREDRTGPTTLILPHTLDNADPYSLTVGQYWARRGSAGLVNTEFAVWKIRSEVAEYLNDTMLVGSKPEFDGAMLVNFIGRPVWHHRLLNIVDYAMAVFDWSEPLGLATVIETLEHSGHSIPLPDHTAEGDVRATRAAFEALQLERTKLVSLGSS